MWKQLYDGFLQFMTITWAEFMRSNGSAGKAIRDNFQNKIYPQVGLFLFFLSVVFVIFFYYYLNHRFGRYYSVKSWVSWLFAASIIVGVLSYYMANRALNNPAIDVSRHLLWFAVINTIYAGILFLLFSLVFKWGSRMGKRTPF